MYIPKLYREEDREKILEFLHANNIPALVTYDGEKPIATHLPVEVIEVEDGALTILGHMSRANPQWKSFGESVLSGVTKCSLRNAVEGRVDVFT